jgi:hypothetical protein
MYRVLAYNPDGRTGWNLVGCFDDELSARLTAIEYRGQLLVAAVVRTTTDAIPKLSIVDANVPRPKNLLRAPGFCRVATAL